MRVLDAYPCINNAHSYEPFATQPGAFMRVYPVVPHLERKDITCETGLEGALISI